MFSKLAPDSYLARRCLQGDRRAFDLLYDRHAPGVYRLLFRLAGEKTRAEDLTQETFLAAFRSLASWQQRGTFRAWLFGIAVRQFRHSQSRHPSENACLLEDTIPDAMPDSDPLDYVTSRQAQDLIERAIQELPPIYREVFVLLRVEGWKQSEAAQILDLPIGTVQSRLWRGVCLLRGRLRELEVVGVASEPPAQAGTKPEEETRDVVQFGA